MTLPAQKSQPRRQAAGRQRFFISLAACLASSLLLFLSSPGAFSLPLLAWIALVPLLWAAGRQPAKEAALIGFACGLAYFLPLLYWIIIVLSTYGQVSLPLSVLALIFLAIYMSGYLAAFAALCSVLPGSVPLLLAAPVCWVGLDLARSFLFTGFPWMDLAYTQFSMPALVQVADLAGHYGVTFLLVMANCLILHGLRCLSARKLCFPKTTAAAGLLLILAGAYNFFSGADYAVRTETNEQMRVAVVQGNIPQDQKWLPSSQTKTVDAYIALSTQAIERQGADLVIWPETALPFYPQESPFFIDIQSRLARPYRVNVLTGAPHRQRQSLAAPITYYNSAFLIAPDGRIHGRYDKQHLVPFGEYIPFRSLLAFASPVVETLGDFSPGIASAPLSCQKARIGVLICFESIFPELARKQVENGATLLVNITNDAWFGRSSAPRQHLAMAVFRAIENRRTLARAANTGISCFIDPTGRILDSSALFETYASTREVPLVDTKSPYTRFGYLFPYLCLTLLIGYPARRIFKKKPSVTA